MKLIYTNENRFIVSNIKNILENSRIDILVKNEYLGGAAGDLSPIDSWMELWVEDGSQFNKAQKILDELESIEKQAEWICATCKELNDASFELCWKCGHDKNE